MLRKNLVIGFLFICIVSQAQDYIYKNFNTSDGLSSSEVYDITQDNNGFLWFATDRGLTSYDGYTFKKYTTKDGITDPVVFNFYEQNDGTILCSTYNKKLFFYDPDKREFSPYTYNSLLNNIPGNYTFNSIKVNDQCDVFINFKGLAGYVILHENGYFENKITVTQGPMFLKTEIEYPNYTYITNKSVGDYELNAHTIEISNYGWYYDTIYNSNKDQIVTIVNNKIYLFNTLHELKQVLVSEQNILIAGEYDENHFWVGLEQGGLKIYDYNGKLSSHLLPKESVTKILKDHEGGLWLTTIDSGVFYIKNPTVKNYPITNKNQNIHSLTTNNKGELYVGYNHGELYKKRNNNLSLFWKPPYDLLHNKVRVQYYKQDSTLLFQSTPFLLKSSAEKIDVITNNMRINALSDNVNYPPLMIGKQIFEYEKDSVFCRTKEGFKKKIFDISHADDGYYLATLSGLFHHKKDSLYDLGKKNPLLSYRIDDIDKKGDRYYLATMGAGLIIKDKDTVFTISTENGLTSNSTTQVYVPREREVYVATNNGFNRILFNNDLKNYSISGFSYKDGLPTNEVNDIELLKDTIWVATKDGLYSVPKKTIERTNQITNRDWLRINSVMVNNVEMHDFDTLHRLSYNQNTIAIGYSAISFKNANNIMYRYRLLNKEKQWNSTKNKEVRYIDLNPGTYTFEIQTKGGNKTWNSESRYLQISIQKPFWKVWWFYSLVSLGIILIIYSFFRFNVLQYNKDIIREFLRLTLKKIKGEKHIINIKESGVEVRLDTSTILFMKSAGNYLEIYTQEKMYLVREKIGSFEKKMPDPLEYIRVHRSYVVRIDKIDQKNHKYVMIDDQKIPVSNKYKENLDKIIL